MILPTFANKKSPHKPVRLCHLIRASQAVLPNHRHLRIYEQTAEALILLHKHILIWAIAVNIYYIAPDMQKSTDDSFLIPP